MTKWTARGSGHLQQFYSTPVATQVSGMARGWAGLTLGFKQTAFRRGALDMLHVAGWRVSTPSLHTIKHIWSYFLIFHWCRCKFCILMQRWKHVFFRIFFQPTKMHLKHQHVTKHKFSFQVEREITLMSLEVFLQSQIALLGEMWSTWRCYFNTFNELYRM